MSKGLVSAIALAGSQGKLAARLRLIDPAVRQQHVSYWLSHGVPAKRVPQIVSAFPQIDPADFFRPSVA